MNLVLPLNLVICDCDYYYYYLLILSRPNPCQQVAAGERGGRTVLGVIDVDVTCLFLPLLLIVGDGGGDGQSYPRGIALTAAPRTTPHLSLQKTRTV